MQEYEEFSGHVKTSTLVPNRKQRKGFEEKSKDKKKKRDYTNERARKRNWD